MKIKSNTFNSITFWSIIVLIALFFTQDVQTSYQTTFAQQSERTEEGFEKEIEEFVSISSVKTKRHVGKKVASNTLLSSSLGSASRTHQQTFTLSRSLVISYCVFRI